MEYVAAHLLIDEDEMLTYLGFVLDVEKTASLMNVNINLLLIKLQELCRMGMDLQLPFERYVRLFLDSHSINIASPKLKKRYRSLTASS